MEKQSFIEYGLSKYASQVLQRYRQYTSCEYEFIQGDDTHTLRVLRVKGKIVIQGESWDNIAFQLSEYMREPSFVKLVSERNSERVIFNERNNNPLRPTYPVF